MWWSVLNKLVAFPSANVRPSIVYDGPALPRTTRGPISDYCYDLKAMIIIATMHAAGIFFPFQVKNRTTKTKKINGWIALIHSFHIDRFDTCMKMIQHWRYNISLNYGLRCNCPKIQRFSNRESFWNLDQVSNEMSWIRILLIVYALRYGRDGCNYYVRYFQFR